MKRLKPLLPSVIAVVAAILVSILLMEETVVILSCLAVALVGLYVALVRCIQPKRSRWRALVLTLVPALLFVTIAGSHIPLRLAFRMYRAEFDRAASQIEAGTPPATPFRIGPFRIRMAGRRISTDDPYSHSYAGGSTISSLFFFHPLVGSACTVTLSRCVAFS